VFGTPDDPFGAESTAVSAAVAVYGVYDIVQQWQHDFVARLAASVRIVDYSAPS
jgi:hypothetical protein